MVGKRKILAGSRIKLAVGTWGLIILEEARCCGWWPCVDSLCTVLRTAWFMAPSSRIHRP